MIFIERGRRVQGDQRAALDAVAAGLREVTARPCIRVDRSLEEYFLTLAKRYSAEANEHVTLSQTYRGTRIAQAAVHHDRLAGVARDAAKEATAAAEMHKGLAAVAR